LPETWTGETPRAEDRRRRATSLGLLGHPLTQKATCMLLRKTGVKPLKKGAGGGGEPDEGRRLATSVGWGINRSSEKGDRNGNGAIFVNTPASKLMSRGRK